MFEILVPILALAASLYLWGLVRTAIWMGVGVCLGIVGGDFSILLPAAILSFGVVMLWLAPYRAGAFDCRELSKAQIYGGFFLTGITTGFLFFPPHLVLYIVGSFLSFFILQIFKLFRFPASLVIFAPRKARWFISALWIIAMALRIFEWKLSS